jgi:hypothetical protein
MLRDQLQWQYDNRFAVVPEYVWALKYAPDQARDPKGSSTGGQFAKSFNPAKKETWYRNGGGWNRSVDDEQPYSWGQTPPDYEPPPVTHKVIRGANIAVWGYSHSGSSTVTGESAKQMGIEGYRDMNASKEAKNVATRMVQAIAEDTTGSEEPLYHAFENTRGTVFKPGDTMDLPLMATAGEPHPLYGIRGTHENQEGAPTVFVFAKGTPMVGYGTVKKSDLEDLDAPTIEAAYKERGHIWDEAIVAGRFRVVKVETKYMGSQHSDHPESADTPIHQIYGQVVYLEPTHKFDPATKKWVPLG